MPRTCTVILAALLSPCVLIAQAVQEDERYLVYHDFILDTPLELRLQFGPTGAYGWVKENHLVVRGVAPKSPADGVLRMHDIITGVNSVPFAEGCDPRRAMADGITQSETERVKGRLELSIIRDGEARTVNLRLKVMGTYSETWPFDCAKSRRVLDEACIPMATVSGSGTPSSLLPTPICAIATMPGGQRIIWPATWSNTIPRMGIPMFAG
ncbi:MAG: DUF6288 domain-containing protein [Planctomycetota bacterium]|nr:DUF6288 domain-containing protein [Planctomycetota bacterium]